MDRKWQSSAWSSCSSPWSSPRWSAVVTPWWSHRAPHGRRHFTVASKADICTEPDLPDMRGIGKRHARTCAANKFRTPGEIPDCRACTRSLRCPSDVVKTCMRIMIVKHACAFRTRISTYSYTYLYIHASFLFTHMSDKQHKRQLLQRHTHQWDYYREADPGSAR